MRSHLLAVVALRGMLDVWNAWYEYHASDTDFDPTEVFAIKADYLETVFAAGMTAIGTLPALPHES